VKSVLIVDDNALIRRLLSAALTESGWIVCAEAGNGREGIAKAQELRPDIIILDLAMPDMNGIETARVIQRIMPTTPLLMFTTHYAPGLEHEANAAGIRKVISKEEGAPALLKAIQASLEA
jgi:two-component system, chemotaxis family, protein-glutamate methylesterase/glutaminase